MKISELEQRLAMIRKAKGDLDAFAIVMDTVVARVGDNDGRTGVVQTGDITIIESSHEAWQGKQTTFSEVATRPEVEHTTNPIPGELLAVPFDVLARVLSANVWRFGHRHVKRVTVYSDPSIAQDACGVAVGEREVVVILSKAGLR